MQVLGDLPGRQPQSSALENSEPPDRCDALAARVVGERERDMRAERDEERADPTPPHPTRGSGLMTNTVSTRERVAPFRGAGPYHLIV